MAEQNTQQRQPQNIFECINQNIVEVSYDVVSQHEKLDKINAKLDMILSALYPTQETDTTTEPKASGAGVADNK